MRRHRVDNRVAHKSTAGVLPWTPQPVDPVGNPVPLTPNTVALPTGGEAIQEDTGNNGRGSNSQNYRR